MHSDEGERSERGERPTLVAQSRQGVEKAKQAKAHLRAGDWASALAIYQTLVVAFPEDRDLRRHLILNAFKFQDYQEVVQQGLDFADLLFAHGEVSAALDRYSEILRLPELVAGEKGPEAGRAVEELVETVKADIYFVYGDHYLGQEQPDLALQYFEASEKLQSGRWENSWGRGQALLLKGDRENARLCLEESIRVAPDEAASSYELLGELFLEDGIEPTQVRPYFARSAEIFAQFECFEDALRVVFRWLQVDTQDREMADQAKELTKKLYS